MPLATIVLYGTVSLLLFGPLAFGAVESWSIFILQAGAAALFLLWAVTQVASGQLLIAGNPLFFPMSMFGALVLFQLVTGKTAYRSATVSAALLYGAYALLGFLAIQTLRRTRQFKALFAILTGYGFAVAIFALFQSIVPNGKLYWLRTPRSGGWLYGPYVNHNHFAGLMEMLTPFPLVMAFSHQARGPRRMILALAATVMVSTIFLSGSRGGMLAFTVQMAVFLVVFMRSTRNRAVPLLISALLIGLGSLAWLVGVGQPLHIGQVVTYSDLSAQMRLSIDRDALKMFTQKPVLGWGVSTFPEVYPQFRSFSTNLAVDAAHNDYLQVLVEMGGLGFFAMLWFLLTLYRGAMRKLKAWPHDPSSSLSLAAMLGVTGILVHSFTDFNLQIPANAALFYVLCAIAAREPRLGLHNKRRSLHRLTENAA